MRNIVYYVAMSIDGFIAGPDDDVSGFISDGSGVQKYLEDLQRFDTVIMGRKTYEYGYKFGMKPGQRAYPHMKHYILSSTLRIEDPDSQVEVRGLDIEFIKALKAAEGADIYLCGGGELAGWLLENELIDVLKVKLSPFVQGDGTPLFGRAQKRARAELIDTQVYEKGLQIMTYKMMYA